MSHITQGAGAGQALFDLAEVSAALLAAGMTPRGAFRPEPADGVPEFGPGRPARTVILAGNAGPAMWRAFSAARDPNHELLDDWSAEVLGALAARFGAVAYFPSERPYLPFQRWARRAEPVFASPLGIHIHCEFGLWHGYRGALAFAEKLALPARAPATSPCADCRDKPCLGTCPADAFSDAGYDVPACFGHLLTAAGRDCLEQGCRARRACPIGTDFQYQPAQARFHMRHFFETRRAEAARCSKDDKPGS